ncbi:MAG TPA: cytochrome c biogenesis protein CcdA [Verrucomicrobiae bacterium]|nr:cytochrome c biogenesis protein CcdA [Verrucomicrobiae bacterium]
MKNYEKISSLILRYGLAATYLYSGYSLIFESRQWLAYVPYWFSQLLPIDVLTYVKFQGVAELLLAAAFITGIWLRPAAFLSALEMILILGLFGFDGVTFRDLAILGGSMAVFFQTYADEQTAKQSTTPTPAATTPISVEQAKRNLTDSQKRFRIFLVASAFILFSIILLGLLWLSNTTKDQAGWFTFSYATGLSMIVLPCTLPLAFVIVPLAMGKDPKKGVAIALAFSAGVTITLSIYGAIIAKLGQVVGLDQAKNIMYTLAGVFAVVFGLGELGLVKLRVPAYSGAFPKFIQNQKDVSKGFLLGLLLGNVGLGCPNPAFYVLLSHIATVGSIGTGWLLTFIHAVGRVTPLMLLAILAALGVDALSILVKRKDSLTRITAWGVVGVGAFILTFGLLGHDWYVYSGIHALLEVVTREAAFMMRYADQFGGIAHAHEIPGGKWLPYGSWLMVTLIVIPLIWNWRKKYKDVPADATEHRQTLRWMGAYVITFSLMLYVFFGMYLPTWVKHQSMSGEHHQSMTDDHAHAEGTPTEHEHAQNPDMGMPGHDHEAMMAAQAQPIDLGMNVSTRTSGRNIIHTFEFLAKNKSTGATVTNLEISHGQPLHLVGIRNGDLSQFYHIHPQLRGDRYIVDHVFSQAGTYTMWGGFVYDGAHLTQKFPEVKVGSTSASSSAFQPIYNRTQELGPDLVVSFKAATELHAGTLHNMAFSVTDSGGFDVPLGKYLQENMHINIISEDLKHYYHLHTNYGMIGEDHGSAGAHDHSLLPSNSGLSLVSTAYAQSDGHTDHAHGTATTSNTNEEALLKFNEKDLRIRLAFPEPGNYKVFGEFVSASNPNKVYLTEFWVKVGDPLPQSNRTAPLNKWLLVVVSVILIGAVMPFVFKYLNEDKIKV